MFLDKRQYGREDSIINGSFVFRNDEAQGDMLLTNLSRSGFKASFDRPISPGAALEFQIRAPEEIMPLYARGKVVWVRQKSQSATYCFDAGIHLDEIDSLKNQKMSNFDFRGWHIRRLAEYALSRGFYLKKFPEKGRQLAMFLPSLFVVYVLCGALSAFFSRQFAFIYSVSITIYFGGILCSTLFRLLKERAGQTWFSRLRLVLPVTAARISAHICYGIFFMRGLLAPRIE